VSGCAAWIALGLGSFAAAYVLYSRFLARCFRLDPTAVTPAHRHRDGADFEPTPRFYLLSQHFSAISAAGPIAGPILACAAFGWGPALLWIVLGCILIGALHDFGALLGSVRHGACSVAEVMRRYLNPRTYTAFTIYIWLALLYVIIAFTDITARAFIDLLTVTVPGRETTLRIDGAGVASSSMLYLGISLLMGVVTRVLRPPLWLSTLVFVPLVGIAIWLGPQIPLAWHTAEPTPALGWAWVILLYCGVASMLPLWLLLQPRGYLGGFFLYLTLGGGLLGLLLGDPAIEFPAFLGFVSDSGQPLVPFLFIMIACGACSGFHGLVCSGTTSRQIDKEPDTRVVGYGAMLLEGVVALIALACAMVVASDASLWRAGPDKVFGVGVGRFLSELGVPLQFAVTFGMLAFATFVYDTLDVCTRLARYLFCEFTGWRTRAAGVAGTAISLLIPLWVVAQTATDAAGRPVPAYRVIWPLFGATNQLLAGLTLLGLTLWLVRTHKPRVLRWAVALPMLFMVGMTTSSLVLQILDPRATAPLLAVSAVLLGLAVWISGEAMFSRGAGPRAQAAEPG
jgi:carbon starvation protein